MDTLTIFFGFINFQVTSFEKQLKQISCLPEEYRDVLAMMLRNAIFDFIDEYSRTREALRDAYRREQDASYRDKLDALTKFSAEVKASSRKAQFELRDLTLNLAKKSGDFDTRMAVEEDRMTRRINKILQEIQDTYQVYLKSGKN